jgi:restriction endonuclease Mrr
LYEVHPRKLEELVASVFGAHFDCHVEHVGRSNDGGIDLVVVDSDNPLLVQVKRRKHESHVEGPDLVREFIGAVYMKGADRGAIVSTARRFSPSAQENARRVTTHRNFKQFDLINFDRLRDMLRLTPPTDPDPWRKHVEALREIPF